MAGRDMSDADFIAAMSQGLPPIGDVIELGNADLVGSGTWTGWDGPADFAPLPQYPQPSDMPDLREWLDRDARRSPARDVGSLAVGLLAGILLNMTF